MSGILNIMEATSFDRLGFELELIQCLLKSALAENVTERLLFFGKLLSMLCMEDTALFGEVSAL